MTSEIAGRARTGQPRADRAGDENKVKGNARSRPAYKDSCCRARRSVQYFWSRGQPYSLVSPVNVINRSLVLSLSLALPAAFAGAQRPAKTPAASAPNLAATLPVDPKVRIGTLPNGLKYYIRQNKKPENRAELRLVVNAGSVLETNDQLGLAHFIEHTAFNGTTHFAKNDLVKYPVDRCSLRRGSQRLHRL